MVVSEQKLQITQQTLNVQLPALKKKTLPKPTNAAKPKPKKQKKPKAQLVVLDTPKMSTKTEVIKDNFTAVIQSQQPIEKATTNLKTVNEEEDSTSYFGHFNADSIKPVSETKKEANIISSGVPVTPNAKPSVMNNGFWNKFIEKVACGYQNHVQETVSCTVFEESPLKNTASHGPNTPDTVAASDCSPAIMPPSLSDWESENILNVTQNSDEHKFIYSPESSILGPVFEFDENMQLSSRLEMPETEFNPEDVAPVMVHTGFEEVEIAREMFEMPKTEFNPGNVSSSKGNKSFETGSANNVPCTFTNVQEMKETEKEMFLIDQMLKEQKEKKYFANKVTLGYEVDPLEDDVKTTYTLGDDNSDAEPVEIANFSNQFDQQHIDFLRTVSKDSGVSSFANSSLTQGLDKKIKDIWNSKNEEEFTFMSKSNNERFIPRDMDATICSTVEDPDPVSDVISMTSTRRSSVLSKASYYSEKGSQSSLLSKNSRHGEMFDDDNSVKSLCTLRSKDDENELHVLRRIFSPGLGNILNVIKGDFSKVPTAKAMRRLDKLEDFSEQRHYKTKFGARFITNDLQTTREESFFMKMISDDLRKLTEKPAIQQKSNLEEIYDVYRNTQDDDEFPVRDSAETFSMGSKEEDDDSDDSSSSSEQTDFSGDSSSYGIGSVMSASTGNNTGVRSVRSNSSSTRNFRRSRVSRLGSASTDEESLRRIASSEATSAAV